VLCDGEATIGAVTGVQWPKVTVAWQDRNGVERSTQVCGHRDGADAPEIGERVHILYDPLDPDTSVVPRILDLRFETPGAADDLRPVRPRCATPPSTPAILRAAAHLQHTLHPLRASLWRSLRRWVSRPRGQIGRLFIDGHILHAPRSTGVPLDHPFSVGTSAWITHAGQVELTLSVRAAHADPDEPSVAFRVMLAMDEVARHVPLAATDAPWVTRDDFGPIWELLTFHHALHCKSELTDAIGLGDPKNEKHTERSYAHN
jgi:hypothetical protein